MSALDPAGWWQRFTDAGGAIIFDLAGRRRLAWSPESDTAVRRVLAEVEYDRRLTALRSP